MSESPLTVRNAEVHTASVTIQTLKIDKRQVTLAVFRQLPRDDAAIHNNGEFAGTPWGTVNYHDRECPRGEHYHLVWQADNELRHALVTRPADISFPFTEHDLDYPVFSAVYALAGPYRRPQYQDRKGYDWKAYAPFNKRQLYIDTKDPFVRLRGSQVRVVPSLFENSKFVEISWLRALRPQRETLRKLAREIALRYEREATEHHNRWEEIQNLPQLFIAV